MTAQNSTPFTQSALGTMLGFGAPIVTTYDQTALTATGTITLTFSQAITKGRLRIKSSATNAATTLAIGNITVTDGTSTVIVRQTPLATTSAGTNFDLLFEFCTDLQATSLSFTVTLAGATQASTISSEFFGNP